MCPNCFQLTFKNWPIGLNFINQFPLNVSWTNIGRSDSLFTSDTLQNPKSPFQNTTTHVSTFRQNEFQKCL